MFNDKKKLDTTLGCWTLVLLLHSSRWKIEKSYYFKKHRI